MGKLSDVGKAAAVAVLDRDKDGDVDRDDARLTAQGLEGRWPVGTIVVIALSCFMLGVFVRGLF